VCVDYSWIIFDVAICPNGRPQEEWLALTEQYSHRICLGSDLVTRFERLGPELLRRVNARRRVFLSSTRIRGRYALRMCVLSFRTHEDRVRDAVLALQEEAAALLG